MVVTSSPLYQPMDGIERLGYELRVYLRVPDLGMIFPYAFDSVSGSTVLIMIILQVMAWTVDVRTVHL